MRELEPHPIDMVAPGTGTGNDRQNGYEATTAESAPDCGDSSEGIKIDDNPLITFVLMSLPESAGIARQHVGVAFEYHGLGDYADAARIITSELVTNAIQHTGADWTEKISVLLMRMRNPDAVAIVVQDSSPYPPVMLEESLGSERGHGLQIIEALSRSWGWSPEDDGKAVFAVLETSGVSGGTPSEANQAGDLG